VTLAIPGACWPRTLRSPPSLIALACALLVGSGLVLRSLWKLISTDPGFDSSHVLTVQLSLPLYKYDSMPKEEAYRAEPLRRVSAVPGVIAVGGGKTMPLFGGGEPYGFSIQDQGRGIVDVTPTAGTYIVTTGYFQALNISLVSGRFFDEKDFTDHHGVLIVNQQLAHHFWPGEDPVGKFLHLGKSAKTKLEVIGVVGDVRNEGLKQESGTAVYMPESLAPRQNLNLFARTSGDQSVLPRPSAKPSITSSLTRPSMAWPRCSRCSTTPSRSRDFSPPF
jgi:hypothetical protein